MQLDGTPGLADASCKLQLVSYTYIVDSLTRKIASCQSSSYFYFHYFSLTGVNVSAQFTSLGDATCACTRNDKNR